MTDRSVTALPPDLALSPMEDADWRFVSDAWQRSYRDSPAAGVVPNHLWAGVMLELLEGLRDRGMEVLVLHSSARRDVLVGFVATERVHSGTALHYLYVKRDFRRRGLAAALLTRAALPSNVITTHSTPAGERLLRRVRLSVKFLPEVARRR